MSGIVEWWAGGEREDLELGGASRTIFVRRSGAGPSLTLLHGFPSCSYDWHLIAAELEHDHSLLLPDLLGFGASDKPTEHEYSIGEQADLVETLWRRDAIASTAIVAHDYSVTVVQELLARRAEGRLAAEVTQVWLMNGGLYPDLHRPEPAQLALLDPVQGPQLNASMTEEVLKTVLRPTFAPDFDARAASADIWQATNHGGRVLHRLIRYMVDRREHERRWVGALEQTDVPMRFAWGMLDPISGAHIAQRIQERLPAAPFTALDDVGHWPPLEAPARILDVISRGGDD